MKGSGTVAAATRWLKVSGALAALIVVGSARGADSGGWSFQALLDGADAPNLGYSVAIQGDVALVGDPNASVDGVDYAGRVLVFVRDGDGAWSRGDDLRLAAPEAYDFFGIACAWSDDTLVVGATGRGAGFVTVFTTTTGAPPAFASPTTLIGDDEGLASFGWSVATDGARVVVGSPFVDGAARGRAYVFSRDGGGWSSGAKLVGSEASATSELGLAVSVLDDTVFVGDFRDDALGVDAGAVYVFRAAVGGGFTEHALLRPIDGHAGQQFGRALSASGDVVVIGAPGDDARGGAIYLHGRDQDGPDQWGEQVRIASPDVTVTREFGRAVAIDGTRVWVSSPAGSLRQADEPAVYVFDAPWDGASQGLVGRASYFLTVPSWWGSTLAAAGDDLVLAGQGLGAAYVFVHEASIGASPPELVAFVADDPDDGDTIYSVADTLRLTFDVATDRPGGSGTLDQATVNSLVAFSQAPGAAYHGQWVQPESLLVTVDVAAASAPTLGVAVAQAKATGGIRRADGASDAASGTSPPLSGDWGQDIVATAIHKPASPVSGVEDVTFAVPGVALSGPAGVAIVTLSAALGSVLTVTASGSAFVTGGGASVTVTGALADVNQTLATLMYRGPADANGAASVHVEFGNLAADVALDVSAVNDAPAVLGPATVTIAWPWTDVAAGLTIADADLPAGLGTIEVSLASEGASVRVDAVADVTVSPAANTFAPALTLTGPLVAINLALATLRVADAAGCGASDLTITVDDLGNVGGAALATSRVIDLQSTPCDATSATCPDGLPISAQLADDYLTLAVHFGAALAVTLGLVACDAIFEAPTVTSFGTAATCAWASADTLVVQLGGAPTIALDATLAVRAGLTLACTINTSLAATQVTIAAPESPQVPVVTIDGAASATSCPGAQVTLQASATGGLSRTWQWTLPAVLDGLGIVTSDAALVVPIERLAAGATFPFTAQVTNAFGVTAVATHMLTIDRPTMSALIAGSDPRRLRSDEPIALSASGTTSCAVAPGTLRFTWSLDDASVVLPAATGNVLTLLAGTLHVGTWHLSMSVEEPTTHVSVSDSLTLIVSPALAVAGASCQTDGECATGVCANLVTDASATRGVCCDRRCGGACESCRLAESLGACTPLAANAIIEAAPGVPGVCALYSCDGVGGCRAACSSDTECHPAAYCTSGGTCALRALAALGQPCDRDPACAGGLCRDGVCCDGACDGDCERCDVPTHGGQCFAAPKGSRPRDPTACDPGTCDGTGGCGYDCTGPTDCEGAASCVYGECWRLGASGKPCADDPDCGGAQMCAPSDGPAPGVCCDAACEGPCQRCAQRDDDSGEAAGHCYALAAGTTPVASEGVEACDAGEACDGRGQCAILPELIPSAVVLGGPLTPIAAGSALPTLLMPVSLSNTTSQTMRVVSMRLRVVRPIAGTLPFDQIMLRSRTNPPGATTQNGAPYPDLRGQVPLVFDTPMELALDGQPPLLSNATLALGLHGADATTAAMAPPPSPWLLLPLLLACCVWLLRPRRLVRVLVIATLVTTSLGSCGDDGGTITLELSVDSLQVALDDGTMIELIVTPIVGAVTVER